MAQSLSQIYIHLTFGTINRERLIDSQDSNRIHQYIIGIFNKYRCSVLSINSVEDHIHILFRLSKNSALAEIIEEVKKSSSCWIKQLEAKYNFFFWQKGYGAFSVSYYEVEKIKKYIENQAEHHKLTSYKEELENLIKKYQVIEYDHEYFWS